MPFVDSPTPLLLCLAGYFVIVGFGLLWLRGRPQKDEKAGTSPHAPTLP